MTDKELQKLGRRDLLQLLLKQAKETEQLRTDLAEAGERARAMDETFQRLRERLDEKDAKIREMGETYDRLRDRLNDKDAKIKELNETLQAEREGKISALSEMGSIAEAALRLNGIFEAAQKAADLYLAKVHEVRPLPEGTVVADAVPVEAVITPAPQESAGPAVSPSYGSPIIVDVEPKVDVESRAESIPVPPSPVQPEQSRQASQPAPQKPVEAREEVQRWNLFQRNQKKKKRGDKKKFVLSFGWEQDE